MPGLIADTDPAASPVGIAELVEALDAADIDPRDEAAFASLAPWLARLGRNRAFLADLAIAELATRCEGQATTSRYGAQVLMLAAPGRRYALRANLWPAHGDAAVVASGTAAFFYDLPHDHNFPFLTYGYLGPGYWSDDYEVAPREDRLPGDAAGLRFVARRRLEPDALMLYRAHRDVHVQRPPDAFSVSLNILGIEPGQRWRTQYRFDTAADTIAELLTTTPAEALATIAVHLGGGNGRDLAGHLAHRHPSARMRRCACDALAGIGEIAAIERAADDPDHSVARHARALLGRLRIGS